MPNEVAPWILKERATNRLKATRYSANLLVWEELLGWLRQHVPNDVRSGRLSAEFIVTQEAFDNIPGDDVKAYENPTGESVWTKKFEIPGSPTFTMRITCLGGDASNQDTRNS